jgi:hypothetical protein
MSKEFRIAKIRKAKITMPIVGRIWTMLKSASELKNVTISQFVLGIAAIDKYRKLSSGIRITSGSDRP